MKRDTPEAAAAKVSNEHRFSGTPAGGAKTALAAAAALAPALVACGNILHAAMLSAFWGEFGLTPSMVGADSRLGFGFGVLLTFLLFLVFLSVIAVVSAAAAIAREPAIKRRVLNMFAVAVAVLIGLSVWGSESTKRLLGAMPTGFGLFVLLVVMLIFLGIQVSPPNGWSQSSEFKRALCRARVHVGILIASVLALGAVMGGLALTDAAKRVGRSYVNWTLVSQGPPMGGSEAFTATLVADGITPIQLHALNDDKLKLCTPPVGSMTRYQYLGQSNGKTYVLQVIGPRSMSQQGRLAGADARANMWKSHVVSFPSDSYATQRLATPVELNESACF